MLPHSQTMLNESVIGAKVSLISSTRSLTLRNSASLSAIRRRRSVSGSWVEFIVNSRGNSELLGDDVPVGLFDDVLDLVVAVAFRQDRAVGVCTHLFVLGQRHENHF